MIINLLTVTIKNNYLNEEGRMRKLLKLGSLILLSVALLSCGGGGGGGDNSGSSSSNDSYPPWDIPYGPTDCSLEGQKEFVYRVMKDVYYWYDKVPDNVDLGKFSSLEELLDYLKYSKLDKWSWVAKRPPYDYLEEGKYIGVGLKLKYDREGNVRVALVYKDSPAERAGLERGDTILEINGKTIEEIEKNNLWSEIWGENEEGVEVSLKVRKLSGEIKDVKMVKGVVTVQPVYLTRVFDLGDKRVGYLVFLNFISPAYEPLKDAFREFKEAGVDELILDLRYNSGGYVNIADELASLISGLPKDKLFVSIVHNDKYSEYNWAYYFVEYEESLSLPRVIVLTTSTTCSASESVINGLKPYIDVVTIGTTTCGKPVGMYIYSFCDKVMEPITFEVVNVNGEGGYFDGIPPKCVAYDDLDSKLGDENEGMLKAALSYLEDGTCLSSQKGRAVEKTIPLKGLRWEIGAF